MAKRKKLRTKKRSSADTVRNAGKRAPRNSLCPCGSGKKFKRCHGAVVNQPQVSPRNSVYGTMRALYDAEQTQAEEAFMLQWGFVPNPSQLMAFMEGDAQEVQDMVVKNLRMANADPKFVRAVRETNCLMTSKNTHLHTEEERDAYNAVLEAHGVKGES